MEDRKLGTPNPLSAYPTLFGGTAGRVPFGLPNRLTGSQKAGGAILAARNQTLPLLPALPGPSPQAPPWAVPGERPPRARALACSGAAALTRRRSRRAWIRPIGLTSRGPRRLGHFVGRSRPFKWMAINVFSAVYSACCASAASAAVPSKARSLKMHQPQLRVVRFISIKAAGNLNR